MDHKAENKPQATHTRTVNYIAAAFLAVLGLFFLIYTLVASYKFDSKVVPFVLCTITLIASGLMAWSTAKGQHDHEQYDFSETKKVIWLILCMIVYMVLISLIGYYIATFLFCMYVMYGTGYRKLKVMLSVSIVLPVLIYFFFERLFSLRIPHGLFFDTLF